MRSSRDLPVAEPSFGPTSGVVSGWIGEVGALAIAVTTLSQSQDLDAVRVVLGCALAAAVIWALVLRPRVVLRTDGVLLRNVYVDTLVPFGLVTSARVRSVTTVATPQRKYVGIAVGRKVRDMARTGRIRRAGQLPEPATPKNRTEDLVEELINARAGQAEGGTGQVRRTLAWPEVVTTVVLAVALAVSLLVG